MVVMCLNREEQCFLKKTCANDCQMTRKGNIHKCVVVCLFPSSKVSNGASA